MNSVAQCSVGIDVAKDSLMTTLEGKKPFKRANKLAGIADLISRLPVGAVIHLEASGGYERLVRGELLKAGFEVRRHNPRSVEHMRKPLGFPAKTDPQDALLLGSAGPLMKAPLCKSVEREELCDLSRTIEYIKRERSRLKQRMKVPLMDKDAVAGMKLLVDTMTVHLESLERVFRARVLKSGRALAYKAVLTVPGVGRVLARALICELPEDLSGLDSRQISAYAGIAPKDDSSGNRMGTKRIEPGNMHLKRALYMPALSALAKLPWAKELYAKLMAKGRRPLQGMVAIMRRLLTMAVAVLRRQTPWTKAAPAHIFQRTEP